MRILCSIIQALMLSVLDRRHHLAFGCAVARQLVRDQDPRGPRLALQKLAKQALGGPLVAPALDQDVQHYAVLVHRAPEPVLLSPDHQAHFIQMPLVSRTGEPAPDLVGEVLAELARPLPDGFMAHDDTAGRQHLFHHAKAQREPEVEPARLESGSRRRVTWPRMSCWPPTRPGLPRQAPPQVDSALVTTVTSGMWS